MGPFVAGPQTFLSRSDESAVYGGAINAFILERSSDPEKFSHCKHLRANIFRKWPSERTNDVSHISARLD